MILQELIRNIVLYNEFIKPYIRSVKDHVLSFDRFSYRRTLQNFAKHQLYLPQKTAFSSFSAMTGTQNISTEKCIVSDQIKDIDRDTQRNSSSIISMLIQKKVVILGKTHFSTECTSLDAVEKQTITVSKTTTGLIIAYTQIFFSRETHEKREYLGEFSLPHEENRFTSLYERR